MSFIINPYVFGSGPTSPSQIAGLTRWYKADSFALSDGDLIGGAGRHWIDQSPSAQDATADAGSEPTYHTNVFGSMPAIQFTTAGSKFLRCPAVALTGECTIIAIGSSTSDNVVFGSEIDNSEIRIGNAGNKISFSVDTNGAVSSVFSGAQSSVRMMSWRRTTGGIIHFREQNTSRGNVSNAGGDALITFTLINFNSAALIGNTIFGEICAYTNSLSDANIDALYLNYFKSRWGLP